MRVARVRTQSAEVRKFGCDRWSPTAYLTHQETGDSPRQPMSSHWPLALATFLNSARAWFSRFRFLLLFRLCWKDFQWNPKAGQASNDQSVGSCISVCGTENLCCRLINRRKSWSFFLSAPHSPWKLRLVDIQAYRAVPHLGLQCSTYPKLPRFDQADRCKRPTERLSAVYGLEQAFRRMCLRRKRDFGSLYWTFRFTFVDGD